MAGALQAIYPLKINEFELVNGDLTYVDEGPYRPLQLRRVNFRARNIRNVKSDPGQYPSEVHLDGDVFEKGKVTVDGHADFLAVPHASIKAAVDLRQIELDYFRPIIERYQLSLRSGVLNTAGNIEYANNRTNPRNPENRDRQIRRRLYPRQSGDIADQGNRRQNRHGDPRTIEQSRLRCARQ